MNQRILPILDEISERTAWASGIVRLISTDRDCSEDVKESADCAGRQLEHVRGLVQDLWEAGGAIQRRGASR